MSELVQFFFHTQLFAKKKKSAQFNKQNTTAKFTIYI